MTLAWELERLRELIREYVGNFEDNEDGLLCIDAIVDRFKRIENALR